MGCHIGDVFTGGIGYADDILLIAPTVYSLRLMLKVCEEFGSEYNVSFNPNKYQLLYFTKSQDHGIEGITHNNIFIKVTTVCKHLGHYVGQDAESMLYRDAIDNLITNVNGILSLFSNAHTTVKFYCVNISYLVDRCICPAHSRSRQTLEKNASSWALARTGSVLFTRQVAV